MLSQNALYITVAVNLRRLTYLSRFYRDRIWHLFQLLYEVVAKASSGQFPPPFLIRMCKNEYKDRGKFIFPTK